MAFRLWWCKIVVNEINIHFTYSNNKKLITSWLFTVLLIFFLTKKFPFLNRNGGFEVFPGNMYEGNTLLLAVRKLKEKYAIDEAIIVADSGLLSEANIEIIKGSGYQYIYRKSEFRPCQKG